MKKMGNLAFTDPHNQLTISNIHRMSTCRLFEKFTATSRQCLGQPLNKAKRPVRKSASKGSSRINKSSSDFRQVAGRPILTPSLRLLAIYWSGPLAILVEDLDDLQGLQGVTTETADGKRSKAGIYPLNGYLLLSFKREIFRFVWVEA